MIDYQTAFAGVREYEKKKEKSMPIFSTIVELQS